MTIGYLGPQGTNCEEAALFAYPEQGVSFRPYSRIDLAMHAVCTGEIIECIVPIENSHEGSVHLTLDTMVHDVSLVIRREVVRPIQHNLLLKAGALPKIIYSHPQALAQCRKTLGFLYPEAELEPVLSTAEAARLAAEGDDCAAVGSLRAADLYGLTVAQTGIQDNQANYTRFIVLGKESAEGGQGKWKTSIVCNINGERPGTLYDILKEFAVRAVNLTRIESRPARTGLGQYIFFFDMDGCLDDSSVAAAVAAVEKKSIWFKNFGSYPVCK